MNVVLQEEIYSVGRATGRILYIAETDSPVIGLDDTSDINAPLRSQALLPVQTHSLNIAIVDGLRTDFEDVDALLTSMPDTPIGVLTADCVPILLYAQDIETVAAVHAGWRGTLGGIISRTLDVLEAQGCSPDNIHAFIGPAISVENYEVDQDLALKFSDAGFGEFVTYPGGQNSKPHIDLKGINIHRLLNRGVPRQNITVHPACTFGNVGPHGERYPSHRRSHGSPRRLLTSIILKK